MRYLFAGNRCRSCPRDRQDNSKHCWCKYREFEEFHYCECQWRKELEMLAWYTHDLHVDCSMLAILMRTIMRRTVSGFARFSLVKCWPRESWPRPIAATRRSEPVSGSDWTAFECISTVRESSSVRKEYVNDRDYTVSCGSLSRGSILEFRFGVDIYL